MKNILRQVIRSLGYDIHKRRKHVESGVVGLLDFQAVTEFYISSRPDAYTVQLVQIGANDGKMHDPVHDLIREYGIKACLVEPQPKVFERLKENYKSQRNVSFENAAINHTDGEVTFFSLSDKLQFDQDDFNFSGMSSLDYDHVLRGFTKYAKKYSISGSSSEHIAEIKVPALRFSALLDKHQITHIDILQIDAEGFDYEIIKMIDFERCAPKIIHFEHSNLPDSDKSECWDMLKSKGYACALDGTDSVCLHIGKERQAV